MLGLSQLAVISAQQNQNPLSSNPIPSKEAIETKHNNPKNLLEAFQHGQFHGNFRLYFMDTENAPGLSDYYAIAAGGGLDYNSAPWYGFSFGIGGVYGYKLASSDLTAKDPLTGSVNRYEIGLFDVEHPDNGKDLDRMQALWLRYQWKKARITVGQQSIQTPFVNSQDGRMRATSEAGAWVEVNNLKHAKIEGGWLWSISPRSTVNWYPIGESIGLYPKGLNPDGSGSGYAENLQSMGIAILGFKKDLGNNAKVQMYNQFAENIFNTAFAQIDYTLPIKQGDKLLLGLQYIHQDAIGYGGNENPSKTYFQKGGHSNAIGTQVGWGHKKWQFFTAYTRITDDGRFLSPREWGREPFYTFMSRERVEGSGDAHSIVGRIKWRTPKQKLSLELAYGHFYLPDIKQAAINKYAFPSYTQTNFDVRYQCGGIFEGLKIQFLYVYKGRLGEIYQNKKYIINKVDMSHFNLILNYSFES